MNLNRRQVLSLSAMIFGGALLGHGSSALAAPSAPGGASVAARRPQVPENYVNLNDFCTGDGKANDAAGFQRAVDKLSAQGGGNLIVPARTYRIEPRGWVWIPSNIAVRGAGPGSKIVLTQPSRSKYAAGFRVEGSNVSFDDMSLVRGNDVFGSFFLVAGSDVWLHNLQLNGNLGQWQNDFSGVKVARDGVSLSRLTISDCRVEECLYGVFQSEGDSSVLKDVVVTNFTGRNNYADDLEFAAPRGVIDGLVIQNSSFADNRATGVGSGFAIGLAKVKAVLIEKCTFDSYSMNPLHIERESFDVEVRGCSFVRASTRDTGYAAPIFIVSGTRQVLIVENSFDLTQQSNVAPAVYVGPGGGGETDPHTISVRDNTAKLKSGAKFLVNYGKGSTTIANNRLLN